MGYTKTYQELIFADDFMFCKILNDRPELAKELLELILGIEIEELRSVEKQHESGSHYDAKSVRFDVYVKDSKSRVFDIEMQTANEGNLPLRARYYTSVMDQEMLDRGLRYDELTETYVIFICTFNIDQMRLKKRYSFENVCVEDKDYKLQDGTHKIFLCTDGKDETNISDELKDFLDYVAGKEPQTNFTKELNDAVQAAKKRGRWKDEYMYWYDHEKRIRKEEREIGEEIGRTIGGIRQTVIIKVEDGKTDAEILDYLQKHFSLTPEDAEKYYLEFRDEALQEMNPASK